MPLDNSLSIFIDHTLLKSTATQTEFDKLIDEALEYNFFSVCIPPHMVTHTHKCLQNSKVKTCSVAGFPLGYTTLKNKENEINELFSLGCDEVDVVLNIANVKAEDWTSVEKEFMLYSNISKNKTLKVIIESGLLTNDEIVKICDVATTNPVTFLKTSTGFACVNATLDAVTTIKQNIPKEISIKASGGIRNQEQALAFIEAGAQRLGCSASINIVKGI